MGKAFEKILNTIFYIFTFIINLLNAYYLVVFG